MRKLAVLLLVLTLVGCGGDDDSSSDIPATTSAPAKSPAEIDKERAGRVVLTAADLPGYTEDTSPDTNQGFEAAFAGCVNNDPVLTAKAPAHPRTVEGKDFEKGDVQVGSEATVAETEGQAKAGLNQLRSRTVIDCIGRAARTEFTKTLGSSVRIDSLNVTSLPVAPAGDEAVGLRFTVTLSSEGETARATSDLTVVRRERAVASLNTSATNATFPEAERASLATTLAGRMAA